MPPPCDVDPEGWGPLAGPDPSPSPAHLASSAAAAAPVAETTFSFRVAAHVTSAWLTRARVRGWLEALQFPADWVDDVEYVVSEAVSNSAEHAYPPETSDGLITIEAEAFPVRDAEGDHEELWQVRVRVADDGRWKPLNPEQQHRGHGLAAIAALAAEVTIRRGEKGASRGTEVIVVSPPAPRRARVERLRRRGPSAP
jgi:anti-sigma regulatory factor (Ser/Thr protein kinase)